MKKIACLSFVLLMISFQLSAQNVLKEVSKKINSLKCIQYKLKIETNYPKMGMSDTWKSISYFDFTSKDTIIGLKTNCVTDKYISSFNGKEEMTVSFPSKEFERSIVKIKGEFESRMVLIESFYTLRNIIPKILANDSLYKTIEFIEDKNIYVFEFELKNQRINSLGDIVSDMNKNRYIIKVDKKTLLPIEFNLYFEDNSVKASFNEYVENTFISDSTWQFDALIKNQNLVKRVPTQIIPKGELAPDWTLPSLAGGEVKLSNLKGKLVLLDFWFAGCGGCMASIPSLNSLFNKYKSNQNFNFQSLNTHDSKENIQKFLIQNKIEFPILYNSKDVVSDYGISSFPCVILIGKDGRVIYSGRYNDEDLEKLIKNTL